MSLYPLNIEVKLIQEDFIEVELIENIIDANQQRKEALNAYIVQTIMMIGIGAGLFIASWAAKESLYFVLFFWVCFTINFVYRYFFGYRNELKLTMEHLIVSNQNGDEFFLEENGFANFLEENVEFLTNEQRRYFDYTLINNIKITKRLFIFVMKQSKEKGLRGFVYMIIPKRDLTEEQKEALLLFCQDIKQKYSLKEWVEKTIFD